MTQCPCDATKKYATCCRPYINNEIIPNTPEALMRSRYTAYSMANIDYIKQTMQGKPLDGFNDIDALHWAKSVHWLSLQVIASYSDPIDQNKGFVEFIATYLDKDIIRSIHERSQFQCVHHRWFYIDGTLIPTIKKRVSRTMPCPCGSHKKFKNCHGS